MIPPNLWHWVILHFLIRKWAGKGVGLVKGRGITISCEGFSFISLSRLISASMDSLIASLAAWRGERRGGGREGGRRGERGERKREEGGGEGREKGGRRMK